MLVYRIHITTTSRFVPIAKEFLCVMCSFFDSQQSVYANQTPYYRMPLSMLRVLLYGSLFHSGIFDLARQPYVLDCFAWM